MADLQSNVTSDVQPELAKLAKIKSAFAAIGVEMKKLNTLGKDFQSTINKTSGPKNLNRAGQVIGKVDGGLGRGFKQIFGDADDTSAFGRIAVMAGVAGATIKAFTAVLGKFEERAAAGAASMQRMNKALEGADAVTKSRIDKGLSQADTHRALLAVGGQEAVDQADTIARSGLASPEEAGRGVLSIYAKRGDNPTIARQAVHLARGAASRGVPFAAAADQAGDIPGEADGAQMQMIIARIFQKHFNRMGPISTQTADKAMLALGNDQLEAVARYGNSSAQSVAESDRSKTIAYGKTLIAERSGEAINPVAAAQSKLFSENSAALQALTDQITALNDKLNRDAKRGSFNSGGEFAGGPGSNFLSENFAATVAEYQLQKLRERLAAEQGAQAAGANGPTRGSAFRAKEQQ